MNISLDELNHAVQRAAMIATKSALEGHPLAHVQYVPASLPTQRYGVFVTRHANIKSAGDTMPWDK